jgi:gluconate 2-dehydrogenase gamma chain
VLSTNQWATVEAICARLIPTDHEPGAREAGCVNFIDKALANEDSAMQPLYQAGLRGIDAVAEVHSGGAFAALQPPQQDAVLRLVEDGDAPGWPAGDVDSSAFFSQIWIHTVWGFLAEPKHGGNRSYAGWRVLGYPGGRHQLGGYTPAMMIGEAPVDSVWGEKLPTSSVKSGIEKR